MPVDGLLAKCAELIDMERRAFLGIAAGMAPTAFAQPWPDFSAVPGTVIAHSPASSGIYLSSPGILKLPNGWLLAKCDLFGPKSTEETAAVTRLFRSRDAGKTWEPVTNVQPCFWPTIFLHRGALYMIGTEGGSNRRLVIYRSRNGGEHWTTPVDANTGQYRHDLPLVTNAGSVVEHQGRIWFGSVFDRLGPKDLCWASDFRFRVMSAPAGADLLRQDSWTLSTPVEFNPTWLNGKFAGIVEGTITVGPDGLPALMMRLDYRGGPEEKALIARCSLDGRLLGVDSLHDIVTFPGGCKKFIVRFDSTSRRYWSLTNWVPPRHKIVNVERVRNTLALIHSTDLRRWRIATVILHHPDAAFHGFHYADFDFDGEDLVVASRTAFDDGLGGAHSQHDTNFLTFHRVRGFRGLGPGDAPDQLGPEIEGWNRRWG